MEIFSGQMMKFSMNVMISSMETITKTMQEIQQKAEAFDDTETSDGTDEEQTSAFSNVSRFAVMPFFEISKLPMTVLASVVKTISETKQEIQEQGATDNGANIEIVSFDEQEGCL